MRRHSNTCRENIFPHYELGEDFKKENHFSLYMMQHFYFPDHVMDFKVFQKQRWESYNNEVWESSDSSVSTEKKNHVLSQNALTCVHSLNTKYFIDRTLWYMLSQHWEGWGRTIYISSRACWDIQWARLAWPKLQNSLSKQCQQSKTKDSTDDFSDRKSNTSLCGVK